MDPSSFRWGLNREWIDLRGECTRKTFQDDQHHPHEDDSDFSIV